MTPTRLIIAASLAFLFTLTPTLQADQPEIKIKKRELLVDQKDHDQPKLEPKAQPEKKKAAEAKISPDAKSELEKITNAYRTLTSLDLAGSLQSDFLIGGQVQKQQSEFTAAFAAPNKFRHEMKGDILVGSTGEKLYAFRPRRNDYKTADAPKDRVSSDKIPNPMRDILQMQNVALMCALADDAGKFLAEGMNEVAKSADTPLDGKTFTTLEFKGEKMDYRILVDPQTHLLRRVVLDMKRSIESTGRDDVDRALLTFDYTAVNPGAKPDEKRFAWSAPANAKDAGAVEAEEGDAVALVGKDAPDFTLNGMDGKPVAMKDQQGSVVVLDFWATWCGPCRASLPGLNKIYKELQAKGMKAFAVDLEESKETIQPVAEKLIPDIPVLLDEKSEVSKKYGVNGIPQTVVVGRDGKIKKVFIGSGNEAGIRAAVEKALAE
jgi:peroxiredoxin/outer membrane lipoprotein-sorting protein